MKVKYIRIGKQLRNLIMRDEHTCMIDKTHCSYLGELYTFKSVTSKEIAQQINSMVKVLEYWERPWIYRLFHKQNA